MSGNYTTKTWNQAKRFGNNFGLIFQATDDLIDYKCQKSKIKKNNANILHYINEKNVIIYCKKLAADATVNSNLFSNNKNPLNELIFEIIQRKL
jgi:geranylgeranyl pyrophosphate synthase